MEYSSNPIYYLKKYYDNIEIGKAKVNSHSHDTYQASSIIIKPFGINLHHHLGKYSSNTLEECLGCILPKEEWLHVMERLAFINMNIMDRLKESAISKKNTDLPSCFYYIGNDILTLGESIYIGKQTETANEAINYENIVILLSAFPYIKVSRHSESFHLKFATQDKTKFIPSRVFDEIKERIFSECNTLLQILSRKLEPYKQ